MSAYLDEIEKKYWMMVHPFDTIGNVGPADISVSCPICMEGNSWKRKHRLHLYMKTSYDNAAVKCFNCDYSTNLFGYLKDNHPNEFVLYKNEKRGAGLKTLKSLFKEEQKDLVHEQPTKEDISGINSGLDFDTPIIESKQEDIKNLIPLNEGHEEKALSSDEIASFSSGLDFGLDFGSPVVSAKHIPDKDGLFLIEPVKGLTKMPQDVIDYIRNRGIEPKENWVYSPLKNKIKFNGAEQTLSEFIIIPLTKGDKWYGFQALAWKQKKFFVYMVTGNSGYKAWNFYNIDKEKPVYIFESIYDAMSSGLENSIAQLGANLGDDRIKELKEPIFCLDNQRVDEKAHEETIKYLERGYKCFIWPEGSERFKDANDLRKIRVHYEKISSMILKNINSGMMGTLKMKMIRV